MFLNKIKVKNIHPFLLFNLGNYRAENGKFHYVFEQDAKFNVGANVISLLSITVGLTVSLKSEYLFFF